MKQIFINHHFNKRAVTLSSSFLIFFFCFAFLLFLQSACTHQKDGIYQKSKILMDTLVTITVVSASESKAEKSVEAAFAEIEKLEKLLNFYSAESEISLINKNAGLFSVKVSSDILRLVDKALYVSEKTEGSFDITIGPLTSMYNFHKQIRPDDGKIREKLPLINYRDLLIDNAKSTIYLKRRGMLIDPGGIAKGYAADMAVETLKKQGIPAGIVAIAGDIKAFGLKPDGTPWKIGIRNPNATGDKDDIMATVELTDMAISTSGDYERYFISKGNKFHHLLDPKTGYPAGGCRSVTIIAKEGVFADAFATGIFILGPEKGMTVFEKTGFSGIIIDGSGTTHITPDLRGKIEFQKYPS
jgi:FAD:protein FMN transferase